MRLAITLGSCLGLELLILMPERTYLSGPMTGYPEFNYPAFKRISTDLRKRGWIIESPHENPAPKQHDKDTCTCNIVSQCRGESEHIWHYYMRLCKQQVQRCDSVIFMPGWPESRGAVQEFLWAQELGHTMFAFCDQRGIVVRMSRSSHGQSE